MKISLDIFYNKSSKYAISAYFKRIIFDVKSLNNFTQLPQTPSSSVKPLIRYSI
jgi:hypothetical protein